MLRKTGPNGHYNIFYSNGLHREGDAMITTAVEGSSSPSDFAVHGKGDCLLPDFELLCVVEGGDLSLAPWGGSPARV